MSCICSGLNIFSAPLPLFLKFKNREFPGGPVVKNLPYNAGDVGLIPCQGTKLPHATGQLSLHATTTELAHLNREPACHKLQSPRTLQPASHNYRARAPWSLCATTRERKPTHYNQREAHTPQWKIPRAITKDPTQPKILKITINK